MLAFATRMSGLREIARRCGQSLATTNIASISHALRRASSLAFVRRLVNDISPGEESACEDEALIAIDSMAVSLPATQRHGCRKLNRDTVGVGLLWTFAIDAAKGANPVRVLKVMEGAWHDAPPIREAALTPEGPVYLMDRGFYSLAGLDGWLASGVRFIVRARKRSLRYERLKSAGRGGRWIGKVHVHEDIIARLGADRAKCRPTVRLLVGTLKSGEHFILVSDRFDWTAERILAAYRKRWQIEEFHRVLKDNVGLAHLYSFQSSGILFLAYTALLLSLLALLAFPSSGATTLARIRSALRELRESFGLGSTWKRNVYTSKRKKSRRSRVAMAQNP